MSNLIACQPGWVAVFGALDGSGWYTEPVACWLAVHAPHQEVTVHPICALGGDVCDATLAANYIGVLGPGGDPKLLVMAYNESRKSESAA
jgi:hypothetical protein